MAAHARKLQSEPSSAKRPISSHTTVTEDSESEDPWELLRTKVNRTIWKHFRAIMTFLQEKTDAIEKLSLKNTTAREKNTFKREEIENLAILKAKMEEYFRKGAETVIKRQEEKQGLDKQQRWQEGEVWEEQPTQRTLMHSDQHEEQRQTGKEQEQKPKQQELEQGSKQ